MSDSVPSSSTDRWWLQAPYRAEFEQAAQDFGQMAPQTWENRPDEKERFMSFLAGLNPLQHLPGVGMIYREITGEEIEPGQRILGGALFGGVLGLVSGLVNAVVQHATGKDIAGNVASLFGPEEEPADEVQVASGPPVPLVDLAPAEVAAARQEEAAPPPAPPAPLAKPAEPVAALGSPVPLAAADQPRWFPARGRQNPRGSAAIPAAPPPNVLALANATAAGRAPGAASAGILPRTGSAAYEQALQLSRQLERHYQGMGVRGESQPIAATP